MYTKTDEVACELQDQFITAVHESIQRHVAGVLKNVPAEEIEKANFDYTVDMLTHYVLQDVLPLGLELMCLPYVIDTVEKSVWGILKLGRKRLDGKEADDGDEEAFTSLS